MEFIGISGEKHAWSVSMFCFEFLKDERKVAMSIRLKFWWYLQLVFLHISYVFVLLSYYLIRVRLVLISNYMVTLQRDENLISSEEHQNNFDKMVKINELQNTCYSNCLIDIVAIIAKVGEKKVVAGSQDSGKNTRDILLFDDSWSMIKLIVRNHQAENYENFHVGDVIQLKNVHLARLKSADIILLTTVPNSQLIMKSKAPEAIRLKSWHDSTAQNVDYEKVMVNLSLPPDSKHANSPVSNGTPPISNNNQTILTKATTSQQMNVVETVYPIPLRESDVLRLREGMRSNESNPNNCTINNSQKVTTTSNITAVFTKTNGLTQQAKRTFSSEDEEPSAKLRCVETSVQPSPVGGIKTGTYTLQKISNGTNLTLKAPALASTSTGSQQSTPTEVPSQVPFSQNKKQDLSQVSKPHSLTSDDIVSIPSDDEDEKRANGEKNFKIKEEKEDVQEENNEQTTVDAERDEEEDIIIKETFETLMRNNSQEEEWNENMDKHLVNHISKHAKTSSKNLQKDVTYELLLRERPQVFEGKTVQVLKLRVLELASARKYTYLLYLCGGDNLKTDAEIPLFIESVEKLRKSMQLLRNNELVD